MRLLEGKKIRSAEDAVELLNTGKLAGMLGGDKFIPNWIKENPDLFEGFVDATLALADTNNANLATDDTIKFLIKFSKTPELWEEVIQSAPDAVICLFSAFATKWFTEEKWQTLLKRILNSNSFVLEDWHELEKGVQDTLSKKQAKKGKTISNSSNLYDTLYDDGTWKLFVPKCFEGSIALASHIKPFKYQGAVHNKTRWCTAAQQSYYDNYTRKGKLYIIQYWENGEYAEAWQAWLVGTITLLDKTDCKNQEFVIENAPAELLAKIPVEDKQNAYYGKNLLDMIKELKAEAPGKDLNFLYSKEYRLRKDTPELFEKNAAFWYDNVLYAGKLLATVKELNLPIPSNISYWTVSIRESLNFYNP